MPPKARVNTPMVVKVNPEREAFFGDLHLHTSYSFDAYLMGASIDPDGAYRFGKGEMISYRGHPVQRRRPLDFLAVTDHSESIGVFNQVEDPTSVVARHEIGKLFQTLVTENLSGRSLEALAAANVPKASAASQARWRQFQLAYWIRGDNNQLPEELLAESAMAWQREIDAANRHYEPGRFTTFVAYEWTSSPSGDNLHRNVIFKGDTAPYPFTSLDSKKPEDLWSWLDTIRGRGHEAMAIPHNGNMSNGLMYDWVDSHSFPMNRSYAALRQANEPLSEIAQIKGSSETHPDLSPDDEFAGYQVIDRVLLSMRNKSRPPGSYLRDALSRGLVLHRQLGINPHKYAFVGGSDFHGGLTVSAQCDFIGGDTEINMGAGAPTREQASKTLTDQRPERPWSYDLKAGPGNLTGVWAESNTRESIYEALRRRETFSTSGTALKIRFFGGWGFDPQVPQQQDWLSTAYAHGVPMGGDLPLATRGASAPSFAVWAAKDPEGANLDRIQLIKVWEENGEQRERVVDVVWSGSRAPDPGTGRLPPLEDTVDRTTGAYENSIGCPVLSAVWIDADFRADRFAAYYLRVLEIPTPRWSTLLALKHGLPFPQDVPAVEQQRGWSSPIWYTPAHTPAAPHEPGDGHGVC